MALTMKYAMPPGEEPCKRHSFPVVRDEKLFKHNKEQYYTFLNCIKKNLVIKGYSGPRNYH